MNLKPEQKEPTVKYPSLAEYKKKPLMGIALAASLAAAIPTFTGCRTPGVVVAAERPEDLQKPSETATDPIGPADLLSDLDVALDFTDDGILSWNFPKGWSYDDSIKAKGYLTFFPAPGSIEKTVFDNTIIRAGQIRDKIDGKNIFSFYAKMSGSGPGKYSCRRKRTLKTEEDGYIVPIYYIFKDNKRVGAIALIKHKDFTHYILIYSKEGIRDVGEEGVNLSPFGAFYRVIYRYNFTWYKDIVF